MSTDSSRPDRSCRMTISRQRDGGCNGRPICSKRVVRAFLRSAMYGAETSSASPPPSARDQLPSLLFIKCFTSKKGRNTGPGLRPHRCDDDCQTDETPGVRRVSGCPDVTFAGALTSRSSQLSRATITDEKKGQGPFHVGQAQPVPAATSAGIPLIGEERCVSNG